VSIEGSPVLAGLAWEPILPRPALVVAAVIGLALLVLGTLATSGRPLAVWIPSLIARLVAAVLLAVLVLRPVQQSAEATLSLDRVAVLVDDSTSMALAAGEGTRTRAQVAAER